MFTTTIRKLALAVTVAVAAIAGSAAEARAQQLVRFAEVESVGGFVAHSDKATFWAEMAGARVRRGLVHIERRPRSGQPFVMTGALTATETLTLWNGIYNAAPWRSRLVHARSVNTDFPSTRVTYLGRYTQEIKANYVSLADVPRGVPAVSRAMTLFMSQAWDAAARIAAEPLFVSEASGGHLGYRRLITITQSGAITDEVTYARPGFGGQNYKKSGQLSGTDMAELARLTRSWSSYPAAFPGNPRAYDAIGVDVTLYRFGVKKTVEGGEPQNRPASFQAIIDKVDALAGQLP